MSKQEKQNSGQRGPVLVMVLGLVVIGVAVAMMALEKPVVEAPKPAETVSSEPVTPPVTEEKSEKAEVAKVAEAPVVLKVEEEAKPQAAEPAKAEEPKAEEPAPADKPAVTAEAPKTVETPVVKADKPADGKAPLILPPEPQPKQLDGVKVAQADIKPAAEAAAPAAEELEKLPLDLPNPAFAGTPKEVPPGINIDKKRLGKKRPPYLAPKGLTNLASEKKATSSDKSPIIGDLEMLTDGDKEALDGSYVELSFGKQWVQIDLEAEKEIWAVMVWHRHMEPNIYRDVVVQVSNDPEFKDGATTIYNNDHDNSSGFGKGENYEYFESDEGEMAAVGLKEDAEGKPVLSKSIKARYVRCWSNGNTADDQNHYTEVEVWGR